MGAANPQLDVDRLTELEGLLGADREAIVGTLMTELAAQMIRIDVGLQTADLVEVATAAHSARNSALMIDAQPALIVLRRLESCARDGDADGAGAACVRLRQVWPLLRRELQQAAGGAG